MNDIRNHESHPPQARSRRNSIQRLARYAWLLMLLLAGRGWAEATTHTQTASTPIESFRVGKVTYLTLAPDVDLSVVINGKGSVTGPAVLVYTIREMTEDVCVGRKVEQVRIQAGRNTFKCTIPIRLDKMSGLLAEVSLIPGRDEKGTPIAIGERPFDVTADFRTNFRYAGEIYPNVTRKLKPKLRGEGHTGDDFWDIVPLDITPQESVDALYDCFQNSANVSVDEGRGHYTCWEEGNRKFWTMSAYLQRDIWELSLERSQFLYKHGNEQGTYMAPWYETRGTEEDFFDADFPWLNPENPRGYYPGAYLMNLDPEYRRPLTDAERKKAHVELHGANSWLEYVEEELYRMVLYYDAKVIWWDNSEGAQIPYVQNKFRNHWREQQPGKQQPLMMVNGEAGIYSDVYWLERSLPSTVGSYLEYLDKVIEARPAVKDGVATIFSGQAHPAKATGQQEGMRDPKNIYNDPQYGFIFRQLLFECLAHNPKVVGQQQWPRSCLDWRIKTFPETFKYHARTWGFQTLFEHVYTQRDIVPYALASQVQVINQLPTHEGKVWGNFLHIVSRSPLSDPNRIYVHLFNYSGSSQSIAEERKPPNPLKALKVVVPTREYAGDFRVMVFSPDFENYRDCIRPKVEYSTTELRFEVPLQNYTLIVVRKAKPGEL